ncbi:N-acetyltransferase [Saccharopolyspora subtropica]|uniref:N-acetyltransferase n=1 Tax=Saccharopolyspora thermophila TaxID=89367 RepID=A0A917JVB2_9PSEU|nr:N-acetyltransferase [Saccharopolyspora subtropica]
MTFVEMTARDQLVPADPVPGLALAQVDRDAPLVTELLARVGAPYGWPSASRTPEQWDRWFAQCPNRTFWLLSFQDEPAGTVVYDLHPGNEVEIEIFGLLPEFVGKGLGGSALTLAVERAWELIPEVSRVWLHTSSQDHPRALPNYHRRGFRTYTTQEGERG